MVRVLLCDDVAPLRVLLRHALTTEGGVEIVGEAGDAVTALAEIERLQPDVVVLDVSMPGVDGLEALPRVRAVAPRAGIVVFSALPAETTGTTALQLGADRYVQKGEPIDLVRTTVLEVAGLPRS